MILTVEDIKQHHYDWLWHKRATAKTEEEKQRARDLIAEIDDQKKGLPGNENIFHHTQKRDLIEVRSNETLRRRSLMAQHIESLPDGQEVTSNYMREWWMSQGNEITGNSVRYDMESFVESNMIKVARTHVQGTNIIYVKAELD